MPELPLLSTVALLQDIPEESLRRRQVGTIVEVLGPCVYESSSATIPAGTYASLALRADRLLLLL